MPIKPRRYARVLTVQLVFGLPDFLLENLGPLDASPEDILLNLEAALESGELSEADVLTYLADRQRRTK
jgi:hypothetical protein